MYWWLCELFYIPATIFLKLSVGVFLHRIALNRWHIWIVRLMMVFSGLFGSIYLFLAIFQCRPIKAWWIRKHSPLSKEYGTCFSNDIVVGVTFASSALNSIADWTFGLLPFFIVKDLHMPKRSKKLVAGILAFANIACIATIVRMPFIMDLYRDDDFLYETLEIALWSNVEAGIGIAAACMATLRPLLRKVFGRRASLWFPDRHRSPNAAKYSPECNNRTSTRTKSYALERSIPSLRMDRVEHYAEISAGSRRGRSRERKDTMITGREIRDLYEDVDEEREQEIHLSTAAQAPACASPGREGAQTPTLEIRKDIEFTFTVEHRQNADAGAGDDLEAQRSRTPTNWPITTGVPSGRVSPVQQLARPAPPSDDLGTTLAFPQPTRRGQEHAAGDVGDPFGAWRSS